MYAKNRACAFVVATVILGMSLLSLPAVAQDKSENKSEKKKLAPTGAPILWREPSDISSRDLFLGPGGEEMKPDISNVTFLEEETGGYSPKFRVRDGAGKVWVAKLGKESQPETASSRLIWAVGYVSEIHYLVPCVQIKGAPEPKKKVDRCEGKGFANVRFEARPDDVKRHGEWSWNDNPFKETRELKGLIVLMALVNNWDLKDSNNKILVVPGGGDSGSGENELHYIISDLGATFGKTGNFIAHNRNAPQDYVNSKFVERVEGNSVIFGYDGKNKELMSGISVEDARWIADLLSKLTEQQIQDAFRAANYPADEIQILAQAVRQRIDQLVNATKAAEGTV
jgi:HAMP domain-containing protein